ncbi:hypothetical protein MMC31_002155, partial [Peltigera leucophlebia]|nr:hypothetical protein [Peltigera leucophlebia]
RGAIMGIMALCLPWLVIKKMNILGKTGTAFGALVAQIEPLNPLLEDPRIIFSERDKASANLWSIRKQFWEAKKKATEQDARKGEAIEALFVGSVERAGYVNPGNLKHQNIHLFSPTLKNYNASGK